MVDTVKYQFVCDMTVTALFSFCFFINPSRLFADNGLLITKISAWGFSDILIPNMTSKFCKNHIQILPKKSKRWPDGLNNKKWPQKWLKLYFLNSFSYGH